MTNRRQDLIMQKLRTAPMRTNERNRMENRWLNRKLGTIDWTWQRQESILNKEIKRLRADLRNTETTQFESMSDCESQEDETVSVLEIKSECPRQVTSSMSMVKVNRIKSAPTVTSYSSRLPVPKRMTPSARSRLFPACKFESTPRVKHCQHFPCFKSRQYNRDHVFGYLSDDPTLPPLHRVMTSSQVSTQARERFIDSLEMHSVRRPRLSSLHQAIQKENSLKKIIADKKTRSEANRPKDWCVNYGKPTPTRKLYNALRPSSAADFQGI